jgi:hypothetical protein
MESAMLLTALLMTSPHIPQTIRSVNNFERWRNRTAF